MARELDAYRGWPHYLVSTILLPLRMLLPQPLVSRIPYLETNSSIRTNLVLSQVRGRLLDIGCGENRLVRAYQARGKEGVGVDVHDWGDVDILVSDTSRLPVEDNSFDSITFVACLNHIPNRVAVLREAARLLRPGGQVILTNLTPTISRVWHAWAFWDADQHDRGMAEGEVYGFTHGELTDVLEQGGFRVREKTRFSWGLNSLYVCEQSRDAAVREPRA